MKIGMIGMSHLGLVCASCFAKLGYEVLALDESKNLINDIVAGKLPVFESGLIELLSDQTLKNKTRFSSDFSSLKDCSVVILTLDTPLDVNGDLDLLPIFRLIDLAMPHLKPETLFLVSSQVEVGTCDLIDKRFQVQRPDAKIEVVCFPENLRVGQALEYFFKADRFVIGTKSKSAYLRVCDLLAGLEAPKVWLSRRSAELSKHALNAHLALQVSFINEIADLCEGYGADVQEVAAALRLDSRIGKKAYLDAGIGITSPPIMRELRTLLRLAAGRGKSLPTIQGVVETNKNQPGKILEKVRVALGELLGKKKIGIFGFAYKEGTAFTGQSAAPLICEDLRRAGVQVRIYDPHFKAPLTDNFWWYKNPYLMSNGCDALLFLNPSAEFRELNFLHIRALMRRPVIIDARNFLPRQDLEAHGFLYIGIGRAGLRQ